MKCRMRNLLFGTFAALLSSTAVAQAPANFKLLGGRQCVNKVWRNSGNTGPLVLTVPVSGSSTVSSPAALVVTQAVTLNSQGSNKVQVNLVNGTGANALKVNPSCASSTDAPRLMGKVKVTVTTTLKITSGTATFAPSVCPMKITRSLPAPTLSATGSGTSIQLEVDVNGKTLLEAQDALQTAFDTLSMGAHGLAMLPMVTNIKSRSVNITIAPCGTTPPSSSTEQLRQSLQDVPSFEVRGSYLQRNNVILGR